MNDLRELLDDLRPGVLKIINEPGENVVAGDPVIYDASQSPGLNADDIILAVGVPIVGPEALSLVAEAGAAKAAAVVFHSGDQVPKQLIDMANRSNVAILSAPAAARWEQLLSLLRTAKSPDASGSTEGIGDLFALANAVAAMVGGPTTIEDPQSRVLAYSSSETEIDEPRRQTILGRQVPARWRARLDEAGIFKKLWTTEDVVRYEDPAEPIQPRLAIAVRAGGEILGSIWVAESARRLGDEAEAALRESARIAALHLIRHRTIADLDRRRRSELLASVLQGREPPEMVSDALGLEPGSVATVIAFELPSDQEAEVAIQSERVTDLISLYCESYRRLAAVVGLGRVIYVLLPEAPPGQPDRAREVVTDLAGRIRSGLGIVVRTGIGSTLAAADMLSSRREADQVLVVLRGRGSGSQVADIEEVRSAAILNELRNLSLRESWLGAGRLEILRNHDSQKKTSHIATLASYLNAFGDIPTAAAAINVHPNTFRYRLRRLLELTGLDLDDADERLVIELQLRLSDPGPAPRS